LCWSDTLAPQIALKVQTSDFSIDTYRRIASAGLDFLQRHRRVARAHIGDLLENDLKRRGPDGQFMAEVLAQMERLAPHLNDAYVLGTLDRFLDTQRMINAVNAASDLLHNGDLEQAREVLRAPDLTPKDDPGVWLGDHERWFGFLRDDDDDEDLFSSGIDTLDEHNVRPRRGEMFQLLAAAGKGKSWFLVNVGRHNVVGHRNVLHITLENSLNVTLQRYTQAFLSLTYGETKNMRMTVFEDAQADEYDSAKFRRRLAHSGKANQVVPKRDGPESDKSFAAITELSRGQLQQRLEPLLRRGRLLVKHFPTGMLTMGMLVSYLDALERNEKFTPDIVLLDYLALMNLGGDPRYFRHKLSQLARDLRGLAEMRNCAMVTVAQTQREAAGNRKWVSSKHVAEDWTQVQIADTFVTYSQTKDERERQLARIAVEKARNSRDRWSAYIIQEYEIGQFCLDSVYGATLQGDDDKEEE
jgi:hypothetical protein